ncbi:hypothetical protein [Streptomyces nigrescens]|uniref:hypothetical protein n=1 Tax=Streptomyces nigrescens TaxID=1920 RepID=UPI0036F5CFA1
MIQPQTDIANSACIYLCYSASRGVTAFTGGSNYRWASTALKEAGFIGLSDGTYCVPPFAPDATRKALLALTRLARTHRAAISTLDRPFLGDVASRVAQNLPGDWSSEIVVHSVPVWQQDHLDWLWDRGGLAHTLITERVPYAALLTNGTDELLMIERPGHEQLFIGACLPTDFNRRFPDNRHFSKTPYAPNSICPPHNRSSQPRPSPHSCSPATPIPCTGSAPTGFPTPSWRAKKPWTPGTRSATPSPMNRAGP